MKKIEEGIKLIVWTKTERDKIPLTQSTCPVNALFRVLVIPQQEHSFLFPEKGESALMGASPEKSG
jgi:hypothetical protein